ncbi:MAG: PTS transporter subunit EIIB [Bacilli bacterium]|nr:PTS transporter subunit EIIB [Bacilli bacterium]
MWQYIIIILILILIAFAILKAKNKDFKLEANKLIEYLGGSANIISYEDNKSRFIVELHNIELVNKDAIQKMGAQGIVEIDNQLKIIFGEDAKQLRKYIDELK